MNGSRPISVALVGSWVTVNLAGMARDHRTCDLTTTLLLRHPDLKVGLARFRGGVEASGDDQQWLDDHRGV